MRIFLRDDALYMGDNGRLLCGRHSGASARYTGRDISGQPVLEITGATLDALIADIGDETLIRCEIPSCGYTPKRVALVGGAA